MLPDLGDYSVYVIAAYGVSLGLIAALILLSAYGARRARQRLERIERETSQR